MALSTPTVNTPADTATFIAVFAAAATRPTPIAEAVAVATAKSTASLASSFVAVMLVWEAAEPVSSDDAKS